MPGMDGTGPQGQGPMTGRGLGTCSRGQGLRRRIFCPRVGLNSVNNPVTLTGEEEKKILEAEKADIEKRLKELKTK